MGVSLVNETRDEDDDDGGLDAAMARLRAMTEPDEPAVVMPPRERVVVKRLMPEKEVLQVMNAMAAVLTVRLMLMLAVVGVFALSWLAIKEPTELRLWVVGIFALVTIPPLAWLSRRE